MGRLGIGLPAGRKRRIAKVAPSPTPTTIGVVEPSPTWNGVAASGFATTPVDPPRITAKPALRLIVPPRQAYTDDLLVGVYAGANADGSLYENMGLSHVRVHFEGATIDIPAPSRQSFSDANGKQVSYFGWWARIRHNGISGAAQLYFEAVPSDTAMQNRVVGPFTFLPSASVHDFEITVAPSQPEIAGQRYKTLRDARNYCRSQSARRPRITITEAGPIVFGDTVAAYVGEGYVTYEASVPVTITLDAAAVAAGTRSEARFRSKYGRQHFRGTNISIDFAEALEVYNESGLGSPPDWFDGVNLINSAGRDALWRGYPRSRKLSTIIRGMPYLTECSFTDLPYNATSASLARGCKIDRGWQEVATGSDCVIGNTINDFDSGAYIGPLPALIVSYSGPAAAATLSCSGNWDSTSRVFTARIDGADIATFTVQDSDAAYHAGTNYTVANVAAWINGLEGWNATVLDDTRFATALSIPGASGGAFTNINVTGAGYTFVTEFDIHADFYQVTHVGKENGVLVDNFGGGIVGQSLFMKDGPSKDFLVLNNVFDNTEFGVNISQLGNQHSHVVIAHNSWSRQNMWLRVNVLGYNADGRCLIANNTMPVLNWEDAVDGDVSIIRNHLHSGATAISEPSGTPMGGDEVTNFVDAANGNFTPAGQLATKRKTSVLAFDMLGKARGRTAPAGALI